MTIPPSTRGCDPIGTPATPAWTGAPVGASRHSEAPRATTGAAPGGWAGGRKELETSRQIRSFYTGSWRPPAAFE